MLPDSRISAAMDATENDYVTRTDGVDQIIGKTSQYRPPHATAHLTVRLGILQNGSDSGLDRVEKLSPETRLSNIVPLRRSFDLALRQGTKNNSEFRA
jgi:hypothetical protein